MGLHGISEDKGNNSKDSMVLLGDTPYHFVGSLKPYDYKHFLEIALEKFQKTFIKGIDKRNKEFEELVSKIGRRRYRTKSAFGKTILFTNNHALMLLLLLKRYQKLVSTKLR